MENGTTHQKYLQDKHPEVKTVAYDSYQNAIIDLKNGRIDGVFGDTAVVNEWLKTTRSWGSHAESDRPAILRHRTRHCRAPG